MLLNLPSAPAAFWFQSVVLTVVGVLLCRLSKKLYLVVAPVCLLYLLRGWLELASNPTVRDGIVTQFGLGRLLQMTLAEALPLMVVLIFAAIDYRQRPPTRSV